MSLQRLKLTPPLFLEVGFVLLARIVLADQSYDPLRIASHSSQQSLDLVAKKTTRDREIPLRVCLPTAKTPAPVVIFSHGLGGSREGSAFLGKHWAARGYVAVFTQHPGSDEALWRGKPFPERMEAMRRAVNIENFLLRAKDISAVIDQLEAWNVAQEHRLKGCMDLKHIGMSGHSFGATTTQAVSGQWYEIGGTVLTDPRIAAAIVMSPSAPNRGLDPHKAFGEVKIPWMIMTGTKDVSPIGRADAESRLAVFRGLPAGSKYELVLNNAEHSAFIERPLPGDKEKRNPNHYRVINALSTAFWDAYLREDAAAKAWLDGEGPKTVLEPDDRWQKK